jgi:hypothetical protein
MKASKYKNEKILKELYKRPVKDSKVNTPKFNVLMAGIVHQADILFITEDPHTKDKFILVVVDDLKFVMLSL